MKRGNVGFRLGRSEVTLYVFLSAVVIFYIVGLKNQKG